MISQSPISFNPFFDGFLPFDLFLLTLREDKVKHLLFLRSLDQDFLLPICSQRFFCNNP
jgi:hypothetical protein